MICAVRNDLSVCSEKAPRKCLIPDWLINNHDVGGINLNKGKPYVMILETSADYVSRFQPISNLPHRLKNKRQYHVLFPNHMTSALNNKTPNYLSLTRKSLHTTHYLNVFTEHAMLPFAQSPRPLTRNCSESGRGSA